MYVNCPTYSVRHSLTYQSPMKLKASKRRLKRYKQKLARQNKNSKQQRRKTFLRGL